MQFQKLSAPSLKELFVAELENKILSGELPIGAKLPSERELAASMQVSRAVVNAGIAEMEQKGFLVIKPRIGTFVSDYHRRGSLETLVSIMKHNGGALSHEEITSILELRIVLVNLAATLAIEHASDEQLSSLKPILSDIQGSANPEALVEHTFRLYHELGYISGNALLPLLFNSFKDLVCALWQRYILNYGMEALIKSSEEFMELLLKRDREAAVKYVAETTQDSISGNRPIF
jgi:DNA-binding FadR family transcriptional regulator